MKLLSSHFIRIAAGLLVVLSLPVAVQGQTSFTWLTNLDQTIDLEFGFGPGRLPATSVTIPDTVTGRPVTQIGRNAFTAMNSFITNIVIPDSVYEIDGNAFRGCRYLSSITIGTGVTNLSNYSFAEIGNGVSLSTYPSPARVSFYFSGNAPSLGSYTTNGFEPDDTVFYGSPKATVYYLAGTTGWSDTLGGLPTALWLPQMQPSAVGSGGVTTQMAFKIIWAKGRTVVVENCNDLLNPAWQPVATNT